MNVPEVEPEPKRGGLVLSSAANSLRVLELLAQKGEIGVTDIARELDFTVGTAFRLVSTLVDAGFAQQSSTNKKYGPGLKVLELANMIRSRANFIELAHPHLEMLMSETNETVNLGVLHGDDVAYVDRVVGRQQLIMEVRIGSRVPAYCTALGKTLLAHVDPQFREAYLARLPYLPASDGTAPPPRHRLAQELEDVVKAGVGYDRGELSPDVVCVAAPILDADGRALAAVSVSGPRHRMEKYLPDLTIRVRSTAADLSDLLQRIGPAFTGL